MAATLIKLELTFKEVDGKIITHTLEGEDAEKWHKWTDGLCVLASNRGQNPDWSSLNWQEKGTDSPPASEPSAPSEESTSTK